MLEAGTSKLQKPRLLYRFLSARAVGAALGGFLEPHHKCKSKTRNFYMCAANTKCDAEVSQEGESGRGREGEAVTELDVPA